MTSPRDYLQRVYDYMVANNLMSVQKDISGISQPQFYMLTANNVFKDSGGRLTWDFGFFVRILKKKKKASPIPVLKSYPTSVIRPSTSQTQSTTIASSQSLVQEDELEVNSTYSKESFLPYTLVDSNNVWLSLYEKIRNSPDEFISLDVEFVTTNPEEMPILVLIQIGYTDVNQGIHAAVIDFEMMEKESFATYLKCLFSIKTVVVHDGRMEVLLLKHYLNLSFSKVIDTQIAYEMTNGVPFTGLNTFLKGYGLSHTSKVQVHSAMNDGINVWKKPFTKAALKYAADDVLLLQMAIIAFKAEESNRKVKLDNIWMLRPED